MPHITVEYSANLEADAPIVGIIDALHAAALTTGVFELGAIRTRAERRDVYKVADGDPDNAFVAVIARIGSGRDLETRQSLAQTLMTALEGATKEAFARRGLGLTVEVQEITGPSLKTNNLHARMKAKYAKGATA